MQYARSAARTPQSKESDSHLTPRPIYLQDVTLDRSLTGFGHILWGKGSGTKWDRYSSPHYSQQVNRTNHSILSRSHDVMRSVGVLWRTRNCTATGGIFWRRRTEQRITNQPLQRFRWQPAERGRGMNEGERQCDNPKNEIPRVNLLCLFFDKTLVRYSSHFFSSDPKAYRILPRRTATEGPRQVWIDFHFFQNTTRYLMLVPPRGGKTGKGKKWTEYKT